jgi:hypothetical protein
MDDYRNPIIAEAMKEMKYVNMFNQGVRRVQEFICQFCIKAILQTFIYGPNCVNSPKSFCYVSIIS